MMDVVLEDAHPAGEHDRGISESSDKELVLEHTEEAIRNAVTAAIDRIVAGTFGVCESCRKPIPKTRLDAIPYTAYCVDCEREQETR
jgi:RNA polymerase-binding transcription factor DksA